MVQKHGTGTNTKKYHDGTKVSRVRNRLCFNKITKTLFLQIVGHAAFIKQKKR